MWVAVVGRIPGDDEDSCIVYECESAEAAIDAFRQDMHDDNFDDDEDRLNVIEQYGDDLYVTHTLTSESPITLN
jgi:hypothetical protein